MVMDHVPQHPLLYWFSCFSPQTSLSTSHYQNLNQKMKTANLLTNTILNRRNHKDTTTTTTNDDGGGSNTRRKKILATYGIILPKKVCLYIRNALRRKKSNSSEGEERIHSNTCYGNNDQCVDEEESPNLEEVHAEKGSMVEENRDGRSKISFINSWKQQQTDDDHNNSPADLQHNKNVSPAAAKQTPMQELFPFSGTPSEKLISEAGSRKLGRVPSMRFNRFWRREPTTREKTSKQEVEAEAEAEEIERREVLCKKRILMGGKCRPLNVSGSLHYDSEGILVPEEILSCED